MLTTENKAELREFIRANHASMSANKIAEKFNTAATNVLRYAKEIDINFEHVQPNLYDVSLYDKQIKDNWELLTIAEIARRLDVSQKYVWKIAARMGLASKESILRAKREEVTLLLFINRINSGPLTAKKASILMEMHISKVKKLLASVNKLNDYPFSSDESYLIVERVRQKLLEKSMTIADIDKLVNSSHNYCL